MLNGTISPYLDSPYYCRQLIRPGRTGMFPCAAERSRRMNRDFGMDIYQLFGKTLGVVGCGAIGLQVARLGNAFGCRLLGFEPHVLRIDDVAIDQVELDALLRGVTSSASICP
jgi:phosphoglycerate dehydrogenase-like enzyme